MDYKYLIVLLFYNLDYIIVEGARRQERRWDPLENEQVGLF